MKNVVIGIHGLGNKPDRDTLYKWWKMSLHEGLSRASFPKIEFDLELVYWADLLHEAPQNLEATDKNDPLFIDDPYLQAPTNQENYKPSEIRRKIVDMVGSQLEGIFLKKDLTINFSSVNDYVVRRFFSDLDVYYNTTHEEHPSETAGKRAEIRSILAEVLLRNRKKRIILIAHSMGSIIAYDVLNQLKSEVGIDTFVTVGCPLGIPIIRSKLAKEHGFENGSKARLKTPENVRQQWINLADLRDKIALYHKLGEAFSPNPNGIQVIDKDVINDYQVNGDKNPHKAYGYLRTQELAQILYDFMTYQPPGLMTRLKNWFASVKSTWLS